MEKEVMLGDRSGEKALPLQLRGLSWITDDLPYLQQLSKKLICVDCNNKEFYSVGVGRTDNNKPLVSWELRNESVTKKHENGFREIISVDGDKDLKLKEFLEFFINGNEVLEDITLNGIDFELTQQLVFKVESIHVEMANDGRVAVFQSIMERIDPATLLSATVKGPWFMAHLLRNDALYSNASLCLEENVSLDLALINAKKIDLDPPRQPTSEYELSGLAQRIVQNRGIGFVLTVEIKDLYPLRELIEQFCKWGWEEKLFNNTRCATFASGDKEINVYFDLRPLSYLKMAVTAHGTARQESLENYRSLTQFNESLKWLQYRERERINLEVPYASEFPYYYRKVKLDFKKKSVRFGGVWFKGGNWLTEYYNIVKNFDSEIHTLEVLGDPGSHYLGGNTGRIHTVKVQKLILNYHKQYIDCYLFHVRETPNVVALREETLKNSLRFFYNSVITYKGDDSIDLSDDSDDEVIEGEDVGDENEDKEDSDGSESNSDDDELANKRVRIALEDDFTDSEAEEIE